MEEKNTCPVCAARLKHRDKDSDDYKKLISRLNKAEGQVRGIKRMVEEDRYCMDIFTQVSAVISALNSFNRELLSQHIRDCVVDDIREGNDNKIEELIAVLSKYMK